MHEYTTNVSPILERQAVPKEKQRDRLLELVYTDGVDHDQQVREILTDTPLPDWNEPDIVGKTFNHYTRQLRNEAVYFVARKEHSDKEIAKYLRHLPGVAGMARNAMRPYSAEQHAFNRRNTKGLVW